MDYIPTTKISSENKIKKDVLRVLLDSGSTASWIRKSYLRSKDMPIIKIPTNEGTTIAGKFKADEATTLQSLKLQELDPHRTIEQMKLQVFDAPCRYDAIIGRDVLTNLGIILDSNNKTIEWDKKILPMQMIPSNSTPPNNSDDAFLSDTIWEGRCFRLSFEDNFRK